MSTKLYLREDAYFEPLINHWFAWSYLIPPVQASRYITSTHKRIMTSFVKNSQLHIMATQESALTGGEFLNAREDQVKDIQGFLDEIDNKYTDICELSEAVKTLDELIRSHTSGESIEYLYELVPDPLKGYVEIFLDMNHNPSYRILEKLMYNSEHYNKGLQTVSFGVLTKVEERPFAFSTPRIPDENHIQLPLDFNHPDVETIIRSRTEGAPAEEIEAIFSRHESIGGLDYRELFTEQAPTRLHQKPKADELKLTFLGHASFMLETQDVSILMDPVIAVRGESYADDCISYSELPDKIDYICITHNHQDHYNIETLIQLRHKTDKLVVPVNNGGSLADPSMKLIGQELGFEVIEVDDFDEILIPDGKLIAIPFLGEHGDLNVRSKNVWFIELKGKKFFFGADATNCDSHMYKHVHKLVGDVDILAIGMECVGAPYTWLYGALNTKIVSKNIKNSRRLNGANAEQAYHMVDTFNAKHVYLYAMGMEPWYKYFMGVDYEDDSEQIIESDKMINFCSEKNIPCERMAGKAIINL
ncbi:tyrosine beta-hydroxylase [Pseudoalteromonas luteoviolacea]|uniref:Tyrosine beta-hydroxylase n=1 Tax=Pseudoalteromonas luteoviolacea TaxID=43657 RepID=A0A1C0TK18_9GAMM|nr:MBL fold metallo-hydrolase [Pseudoalteromonas luteoviolacea]MBQ4814037.1 MBL fold metallo-hydrolase [Pseudoalteromonas luteoviolacea]OCQ18694.1 tyrosine beta-hydroxylase [Pseudoalteromonas luteoviolacea]